MWTSSIIRGKCVVTQCNAFYREHNTFRIIQLATELHLELVVRVMSTRWSIRGTFDLVQEWLENDWNPLKLACFHLRNSVVQILRRMNFVGIVKQSCVSKRLGTIRPYRNVLGASWGYGSLLGGLTFILIYLQFKVKLI